MLKKVCGLIAMIIVATSTGLSVVSAAVKPTDDFYANDYIGELSDSTITKMVDQSAKLYEENGSQVVTVLTDYYVGGNIDDYANTLFDEWGIGSKDDNNGVLFLIALSDGDVTIKTGDGMLGVLPASKCGNIIDTYFVPYARDDINKAVLDTHNELVKASYRLNTEGAAAGTSKSDSGGGAFSMILAVVAMVVIVSVIYVIWKALKRSNRRGNNGDYIGGYPGGYGNSSYGRTGRTGRSYSNHSSTRNLVSSAIGGFVGSKIAGSSSSRPRSGSGGISSGSGSSRSFGSSSSSSRSSGSRSSSSSSSMRIGGGGRSSGSGASRKF